MISWAQIQVGVWMGTAANIEPRYNPQRRATGRRRLRPEFPPARQSTGGKQISMSEGNKPATQFRLGITATGGSHPTLCRNKTGSSYPYLQIVRGAQWRGFIHVS